ncbi:uncharacterized protein M421DRAFT_10293 [Didymella exigua CBS 183.55]|uniref:Uncharacterized protein n=1 Tax=Didymella exigua CBS 183.55 TaxID=1150837 RepID=A0A6A5R6B5_9PLEO|nr:uncharacterized protein M421DRAFT_10293 [Didymella exigua CBS 183.55]KAF1922750.1 hypothetical protein M421DRAFT_10293 [Didymella exigua CBS 183.55]
MPFGLLTADMHPRCAVTAAPVYSAIPVYTFDGDDDDDSLKECDTTPPLIVQADEGGCVIFDIDPLAWMLYVIDEETEDEMGGVVMDGDRPANPSTNLHELSTQRPQISNKSSSPMLFSFVTKTMVFSYTPSVTANKKDDGKKDVGKKDVGRKDGRAGTQGHEEKSGDQKQGEAAGKPWVSAL